MSHIYCPECGFQNPEAANYCSKCGALLVKEEPGSETTMSFTPEEGEEDAVPTLEELGAEGPALVVRSGGGRAGEHFVPQRERTTSAGPSAPSSSSVGTASSSPSSGVKLCVVSEPGSSFTRSAPHLEQ